MTESKLEKPYEYFDTPEGHDVFKKLWVAIKPACQIGLILSTVDIACSPKTRTYMQIAGRISYITLPLMGIAATFVAVANTSVNIRKKDDYLNWIVGACAAGGIFGMWRKSSVAGFSAAAGFSILAVVKKNCLINGWVMFPDERNAAVGGIVGPRYDFSIMKERPRNWTTGRE